LATSAASISRRHCGGQTMPTNWPSFARAVEEARPYRHLFPLGAPDRD